MKPAHVARLRILALVAVLVGLLVSPVVAIDGRGGELLLTGVALAASAVIGWAATGRNPQAAVALAVAAGLALALTGLGAGALRVAAIDNGALVAAEGSRMELEGFVTSPPRRSSEGVRFRFESGEGRVLVVADGIAGDVDPGTGLRVAGAVVGAEPWEAGSLAVHGIHRRLIAGRIEVTGKVRGGLMGAADGIRRRGEAALAEGTDETRAALLAGFVLGQDDGIDPTIAEDFRRSGLAHLMAVSGQNILLLILLAMPCLALTGVGLRTRFVVLIGLVVAYVLVTGAGPSIQRAGVMGIAGLVAALAGRPTSRWYALLLAAVITLLLNPRAAGDVGWQLSFIAVAGIALWAAPLSRLMIGRDDGGIRTALAAGVAMTVAATLATAPLMAHHFGVVSVAALPANVLALPAVAPVMWGGMLAAAVGQLAFVFPFGMLASLLSFLSGIGAGYVARVAEWLAAPGWAQIEIELGGAGLVPLYAVLGAVAGLGLAAATRRRSLALRSGWVRGTAVGLLLAAVVLVGWLAFGPGRGGPGPPAAGELRIAFLDVGQGDAILVQAGPDRAMLVDAGPPGTRLARRLRGFGVERLDAFVATHGDNDHVGGLDALLAEMPVGTLAYGASDPDVFATARRHGVNTTALSTGDGLRLGSAQIDVLWPRPTTSSNTTATTLAEPNAASVVLWLRAGGFDALLTGDAEFGEAAYTLPPGIELLQIPHHGSEDPGSPTALAALRPSLAVVSVGADNPYGHPHPSVLAALRAAGTRVERTDQSGDIIVTTNGDKWNLGD